MIGFKPVVRVLADLMQGAGEQLVQHAREGTGPVCYHLGGLGLGAGDRLGEQLARRPSVALADRNTSTNWPNGTVALRDGKLSIGGETAKRQMTSSSSAKGSVTRCLADTSTPSY